MATLILGGNKMENCQHALVVCGKEVFRLRHRDGDGQLVVDFDLCDDAGQPLAKVVKNNVVHAPAGTKVRHGPTFSEAVDSSGKVIGRAEEVAPDVVRVIGTFGSDGAIVRAKLDVLELPIAGRMSGCTFSGSGVAVEINSQGSLSIGKSSPPRARPGFRQKPATPKSKSQSKRGR